MMHADDDTSEVDETIRTLDPKQIDPTDDNLRSGLVIVRMSFLRAQDTILLHVTYNNA